MNLKVAIIVGSTRPNSVGGTVAEWYADKVKDVEGLEFDVIDLNDVNLPFLDEPIPPSAGKYSHDHTKKWSEKIASYNAYVWVTAEYNHSVPAPLKNSIDFLYNEWVRKPVALVSYGSMGGVRAAEHLRQIASELQMVSIRPPIMIMAPWAMLDDDGNMKPELVHGDPVAQVEDLKWWGEALKTAKNN